MRPLSMLPWIAVMLLGTVSPCFGQGAVDSDEDGLSDALEQALLVQFAPTFLAGSADCSGLPAEFAPGIRTPTVKVENGTIYGQVSRAREAGVGKAVEIHFYHLWRVDCGRHGHPLDAEHVAVLVRADSEDLTKAKWKAEYWYAAAHENTVCDVSHLARAATLHAEDRGAKVWISPGKHASYLNEKLCERGCGADRCTEMRALAQGKLINLGEPGRPMNDVSFIRSEKWPLAGKMMEANFPAPGVARLESLPETDIAWANAGRHPAQGIIAISSHTEEAMARGGGSAASAISVAGGSTSEALSRAKDSTGSALAKSYRRTVGALGHSAKRVGQALVVAGEASQPDSH